MVDSRLCFLLSQDHSAQLISRTVSLSQESRASIADLPSAGLRNAFSRCLGFRRLCFRSKSNGPIVFVEFDDVNFATRALQEMYGNTLGGVIKGGIRLSYSKVRSSFLHCLATSPLTTSPDRTPSAFAPEASRTDPCRPPDSTATTRTGPQVRSPRWVDALPNPSSAPGRRWTTIARRSRAFLLLLHPHLISVPHSPLSVPTTTSDSPLSSLASRASLPSSPSLPSHPVQPLSTQPTSLHSLPPSAYHPPLSACLF